MNIRPDELPKIRSGQLGDGTGITTSVKYGKDGMVSQVSLRVCCGYGESCVLEPSDGYVNMTISAPGDRKPFAVRMFGCYIGKELLRDLRGEILNI
ncbi:MAG: hypothetical protein HY517_01885 [Candidatus Aenigmarchaeota archaeon]|nr:hypothetical protein [Candidatus Aenigmarchaeota archaeon]